MSCRSLHQQMTADSSRMHKASRVEGNVPIFSEDVQFAMPAQKKLMHDSARSSKKSKDITFDAGSCDIFFDPGVPSLSPTAASRDPDPTVEVEEPKAPAEDPDQTMPPPPLPPPAKPPGDGALADSERESSEDDGLTKHRKLVKEAQSLEHRLCIVAFSKEPGVPHMPKEPDVSQARRSEASGPAIGPRDATRSDAIWERIATDFIIVRKLKDCKENAVQVVRDEFSGWIRAYPIARRDTDTVSRNLLLFLGPAYDRTTVMCKSDQAIEILATCKRLGFVHEDTLENRFPHNSQLECDIRTIAEMARAVHLGTGFEVVPDLWPLRGHNVICPARCRWQRTNSPLPCSRH